MKTRNISNRIFQLLLIMGVIIACSKDGDVGATGPQGSQGEQGVAGPKGDQGEPGQDGAAANQGEQGEQGPKGDTGTANVIYSPWIESGFVTPIQAKGGDFTITAPEITEGVIDFGVILVYGKDAADVIYALPITLSGTANDEEYAFRFKNPGLLEISVWDNSKNVDDPYLDNVFRYVIIPGGNPTSGKSASSIDYSKMTYEEIAERFNIPD